MDGSRLMCDGEIRMGSNNLSGDINSWPSTQSSDHGIFMYIYMYIYIFMYICLHIYIRICIIHICIHTNGIKQCNY
jgi:hypothetical protein